MRSERALEYGHLTARPPCLSDRHRPGTNPPTPRCAVGARDQRARLRGRGLTLRSRAATNARKIPTEVWRPRIPSLIPRKHEQKTVGRPPEGLCFPSSPPSFRRSQLGFEG